MKHKPIHNTPSGPKKANFNLFISPQSSQSINNFQPLFPFCFFIYLYIKEKPYLVYDIFFIPVFYFFLKFFLCFFKQAGCFRIFYMGIFLKFSLQEICICLFAFPPPSKKRILKAYMVYFDEALFYLLYPDFRYCPVFPCNVTFSYVF